MTEQAIGGVKTLAIRLPDELHAQLVLVASLDGMSLAEAIRKAVEDTIARRRDSGDLAAQAQAALDQVDREAQARRAALQALLGPDASVPGKGQEVVASSAVPVTPAAKPGSRRRDGEPQV